MRFLPLILVLAVAASSMGAMKMPQMKQADAHACCKTDGSSDSKDKKDDCGTCLMMCCRIVATPADRVGDLIARDDVAADVILPPLVANDLTDPTAIFHPPRV